MDIANEFVESGSDHRKQCLESSLLPIYSKHMQLLQYTAVRTDVNVLVFVLMLLLLILVHDIHSLAA